MFNKNKKLQRGEDTRWLNFSWGFIEMAKGACYAIRSGHEIINDRQIIAILFVIKHSLELFVKRSLVSLGIKIDKKLRHHDLLKLFEVLKTKVTPRNIRRILKTVYKNRGELSNPDRTNLEIAFSDSKKLAANLKKLDRLIRKYYELKFLKRHFGEDFIFTDYDNTAFKYPEIKNIDKIDYDNLIGRMISWNS